MTLPLCLSNEEKQPSVPWFFNGIVGLCDAATERIALRDSATVSLHRSVLERPLPPDKRPPQRRVSPVRAGPPTSEIRRGTGAQTRRGTFGARPGGTNRRGGGARDRRVDHRARSRPCIGRTIHFHGKRCW